MRTLAAVLAATMLTAVAAAQSTPGPAALTLEHALTLAPDASAQVSAARAALGSAERNDARVASDPMALRVDRVTATSGLTNAQRSLAAVAFGNIDPPHRRGPVALGREAGEQHRPGERRPSGAERELPRSRALHG